MIVDRHKALDRVFEILKDDVQAIDGEWGCGHSYEEALRKWTCHEYEIAKEIELLESILRG